MPGPLWWYDCSCRESCGGGNAECFDCRRPGRFVGYTKSVVEHWATFRKVTGLNPLADKSSPRTGRSWRASYAVGFAVAVAT